MLHNDQEKFEQFFVFQVITGKFIQRLRFTSKTKYTFTADCCIHALRNSKSIPLTFVLFRRKFILLLLSILMSTNYKILFINQIYVQRAIEEIVFINFNIVFMIFAGEWAQIYDEKHKYC